jgi:hypothetical protein
VRRAVSVVAHCILAIAVVFGMVHAGSRYFYCEALGLLPSDPCAAAASSEGHGKSGLSVLGEPTEDCCEVVTLAAMPRAAQAAGPGIAPAPWVAVIPAFRLERMAASAVPAVHDRTFEQWRPPPRTSNDLRAQLSVFLI